MSLIFNFADIRSRMLGDDKPAPKVAEVKLACGFCDEGWVNMGVIAPIKCPFCIPQGVAPCP